MRHYTLFWLILALGWGTSVADPIEMPVSPGDRLDISNYAGKIRISTWNEDRIRIETERREGEEILAQRRGSVVRIRSASWDKPSDSLGIFNDERAVISMHGQKQPGIIMYDLRVPPWIPIIASGAVTDVTVSGLEARLEITVFKGGIHVQETTQELIVRSLSGETLVENARGPLRVRGWQGSIVARGTEGDVAIETTSGSISISDHLSGEIDALTVSGNIEFEGSLPENGVASLATHSGDIVLHLPDQIDAMVSVRRLGGTFESDFVDEVKGKSFRFEIGSGRSRLDLESFSGAIRILRQ